MTLQQLTGFQRAEFAKAASLQLWVIAGQLASALVATAAVFVTSERPTYFLALLASALIVGWAILIWKCKESRAQAERVRRATLLMGGLGEPLSDETLRELQSGFTVTELEAAKNEDSKYYASAAPPGEERLAQLLEESAFWSCELMKVSAGWAWISCISTGLLGVVLLLFAVPFASTETLVELARTVCVIVTLIMSGDFFGAAVSYSAASKTLASILPRISAVRAYGLPRADLLFVLADYNAAVEGAPMFLPGAYKWNRDRLNRIWNDRQANA